jgi:hypothetical protein
MSRIAAVGGVPYVAWLAGPSLSDVRVARLEPEFLSAVATPTRTGAVLSATLRTYGLAFPTGFVYGTELGRHTHPVTAGTGADTVTIRQTVGGLSPDHTYHFTPFALAPTPAPLVYGPTGTFRPDVTAPQLTNVSVDPARFAVVLPFAKAAATAPRGTTIGYTLSEPAAVVFKIARKLPGRKVRGKCVEATSSNGSQPRCTRHVLFGSFAPQSPAGRTEYRFSGQIASRSLPPGRYRLTLIATDPAGNHSSRVRRGFEVVER